MAILLCPHKGGLPGLVGDEGVRSPGQQQPHHLAMPTPRRAVERATPILIDGIDEAARVLEEKMVKNARSLDMAMILGTGFPPFRGGLLKYADYVGLAKIISKLEEFSGKYGSRFAPCFYLQNLTFTLSKEYNFY